MVYLKWAVLAPIALTVRLASIILSPVLSALSVALGTATLPAPLTWFYTHDDDLDGGQHQHPDQYPLGASGVALWVQRMGWICRNPGYGFLGTVVGLKVSEVRVETVPMEGGWKDKFFDLSTGKQVGFGYRKQTEKLDIWLGWASPSHDKKHFMLKIKLRNRS